MVPCHIRCSGRCGVSPQKGVAENALAFAARGKAFPRIVALKMPVNTSVVIHYTRS
jgi:hypothetical protein